MTVSQSSPYPKGRKDARRYLRPPEPLFFPTTVEVDEAVPESGWHQRARGLLADSLEREFGDSALVTSDQFLYWDPTNPRLCLAPDVAIRRGTKREIIPSWKIWERGAPHVGVELLSASDQPIFRLEEKLARYRQAGVGEVVAFDRDKPDRPIRIWDLLEGDLVERDLTGPDALRCDALDRFWCTYRDPELGPVLRLSRDVGGLELVPTVAEAERIAKKLVQAERDAAQAERDAAQAERDAALARLAALEAEIQAARARK